MIFAFASTLRLVCILEDGNLVHLEIDSSMMLEFSIEARFVTKCADEGPPSLLHHLHTSRHSFVILVNTLRGRASITAFDLRTGSLTWIMDCKSADDAPLSAAFGDTILRAIFLGTLCLLPPTKGSA